MHHIKLTYKMPIEVLNIVLEYIGSIVDRR
jgi:hypothetical protein